MIRTDLHSKLKSCLQDRALLNGNSFSCMKSAVLCKAVLEIGDGLLAVLLSGAMMSDVSS